MQDSLSLWRKNKEFLIGVQKLTGIKIFIFLTAFIQSRTICLYKIRDKIEGKIKKESKYQNLIRLFDCPYIEKIICAICLIIIHLLFEDKANIPLIMDRTNWKYGDRHINVLVLGILWNQSVFIPICWKEIGEDKKRGNSDYSDRKSLIDNFIEIIGGSSDRFILLADREFIGAEFWAYLKEKNLNFVIRMRDYIYLKFYAENEKITIKEARKKIKKAMKKEGKYAFNLDINGQIYRINVRLNNKKETKNKKEGEFVFLGSSLSDDEQISNYYAYRWKIECCFKHLKTNGFNIEDMAFKKREKIELAFAFSALAYAYCIKEGIMEVEKNGKIPMKRYKDKKNPAIIKEYPEISLFRLGYNKIENQLITLLVARKTDIRNC
jgi:hypothetical protein